MALNSVGNWWKIPLFLIILVLFLDGTTKYFTDQYLPEIGHSGFWYPYGGIAVFKNFLGIEFSINHATNTGAAWSFGAAYQIPLLILRIFLILGLSAYMLFFPKTLIQQIFLACIVGGALGNVLDTFIYGHVVDMLHFVIFGYDFPIFNLADTFIFIGVAGYILTSSRFAKTA